MEYLASALQEQRHLKEMFYVVPKDFVENALGIAAA